MGRGFKTVCSIKDFFERVTFDSLDPADDACWTYRGPVTSRAGYRYGMYCHELVHRVAASLYINGLVGTVKRTCSNSLCVKKGHFGYVGWSKENKTPAKPRPDGPIVVEMDSKLMNLIAELRYNKESIEYEYVRSIYGPDLTRVQLEKYVQRSTIPLLLYELNALIKAKRKPELIPLMPYRPDLIQSKKGTRKTSSKGRPIHEYTDCFPISEIG